MNISMWDIGKIIHSKRGHVRNLIVDDHQPRGILSRSDAGLSISTIECILIICHVTNIVLNLSMEPIHIIVRFKDMYVTGE